MNLHVILLTLHIFSAIVLLGWLAMQSMLTPRMIRTGPAARDALRFSIASAEKIGRLGGIVFLLGLWLVFRADDGIEISDGWVSASMLLFIVATVIGAVFIAGAEKKALAKFEQGQAAPDEARLVSILAGLNGLILLVIVYLMVKKPGGY